MLVSVLAAGVTTGAGAQQARPPTSGSRRSGVEGRPYAPVRVQNKSTREVPQGYADYFECKTRKTL